MRVRRYIGDQQRFLGKWFEELDRSAVLREGDVYDRQRSATDGSLIELKETECPGHRANKSDGGADQYYREVDPLTAAVLQVRQRLEKDE